MIKNVETKEENQLMKKSLEGPIKIFITGNRKISREVTSVLTPIGHTQ